MAQVTYASFREAGSPFVEFGRRWRSPVPGSASYVKAGPVVEAFEERATIMRKVGHSAPASSVAHDLPIGRRTGEGAQEAADRRPLW